LVADVSAVAFDLAIYHKGIVLKYDGWHDSQDQGYQECVQIAANVAPLMHHSTQSCEEVLSGPNNEIECLRLKTKKFEMVIAPGE
jgi:hypothetical protein